ncbi:MAG: hypothetical protein JW861_03480 [Bacteroidales bacterium]|nr:hypothetical protein [Bacteroidales bacterium]
MKKMLLMILLAAAGVVAAQEDGNEYRTIFGSENITHGGYGAISMNYSRIDGKDAFLAGGRGAWVINHSLAIGLGGYGFANDIEYTVPGVEEDVALVGGYGGLLIEPVIAPKYPIHVSVPVLIGAGGVSYIRKHWSTSCYGCEDYYSEDASAFFLLEPGLELELNLVRFMRIALGGYYRITSDVALVNTGKKVLHGFSGGLTLKFGKF